MPSAEAKTEQELMSQYGWQAGPPPSTYKGLTALQESLVAQYLQGKEANVEAVGGIGNDARVAELMPISMSMPSQPPRATYALLDCTGHLLYVVDLRDIAGGSQSIALINVYDSQGTLVAYALRDLQLAKFAFVDPSNGYLLAAAQSPGLGVDVPMQDLIRDPRIGNIYPYDMYFPLGGYAGSSNLLNEQLRWVIAAAMQVQALRDAHGAWVPWLPAVVRVLESVAIAMGVLAVLLGIGCYVSPACRRLCWAAPGQLDYSARFKGF